MPRPSSLALSALSLLVCLLGSVACEQEEPREPPHEPELPTPILAEDTAEPETEEAPGEQDTAPVAAPEEDTEASNAPAPAAKKPAAPAAAKKPSDETAAAKPKATTSAQKKPSEPSAAKPPDKQPATKPEPESKAEPKPEPKPEPEAPKTTTRIPRTEHVQVEITSKMQARLNSDSRMQGWIDKVMPVANQCYAQARAKDPEAAGTIVVKLTMHENSRPSPDIQQLPPPLSSLVACATGRLFNIRMPLFTGPEGESHVVKLHFKP